MFEFTCNFCINFPVNGMGFEIQTGVIVLDIPY